MKRKYHGHSKTRTYRIWCGMKTRCTNPNTEAFKDYGARGIFVCPAWLDDFTRFYADMGEAPASATLERQDNSRGYEPSNCRWATRTEQGRNKRTNRLLTINGESLPLSVWAQRSGIAIGTIHRRLKQGWPEPDAVFVPVVTQRRGVPKGARIYHPLKPSEVLAAMQYGRGMTSV